MNFKLRVTEWLERRFGIEELIHENLNGYLLPRNITIWHALGAVLLTLFCIQLITGVLLLVYYVPDTDKAFSSVTRIMNEIPYGWLFRYLHVVGSNIIIVVLLLHMLSVLFMGAYKRPRELTWLSGFGLLNLALGLCLTGYLLPWSQLSFWATTVATDAPGAIPVIGDKLVEFLRGAPSVGPVTLGRFFALHVVGLPLLLAGGIGFHLFCVRRIGVAEPPQGRTSCQNEGPQVFVHQHHRDGIPFFPNYTVKEMALVMFALAVLVAIAIYAPALFLPKEALEPADPFTTPDHIKPEWYFLWAYQTLKIFPNKLLGLGIQAVMMTALALLPFIDCGNERNPRLRPLFLTGFGIGLLMFVGLSIWGHMS